MRGLVFAFFLFQSSILLGQDIILKGYSPTQDYFEGDTLNFQLVVTNENIWTFSSDNNLDGFNIDSLGRVSWVPSYELVSRLELEKDIPLIFKAQTLDQTITQSKEIRIIHRNRPPKVEQVPVFYVRQNSNNTFNLKIESIYDPDGDPIVFLAAPTDLPERSKLSEVGNFEWRPTRAQFRSLLKKRLEISFVVEDQPDKARTKGVIVVAPTQEDLPPELLMVPSDSIVIIKEDEVLNLKFYVSDPNGDDDLMDVGFVASDLRVPKDALKKNTLTQWEFIWQPGYEFVDEKGGVLLIDFIFYALDHTNQRVEQKLQVKVEYAENKEEVDRRLYEKYRMILVETMNLIQHLDENQKRLNVQLKKARKGKKNRAVLNASLGAMTGLSPIFLEQEPQKIVSGVGGTTVMTLGTLEATEVIGKSKDAILDKIKINIDLRNLLQAEGDAFARKYALKTNRRAPSFDSDLQKLKVQLNNQKLVLLELDASWINPNKETDKNLRRVFPDFNPLDQD